MFRAVNAVAGPAISLDLAIEPAALGFFKAAKFHPPEFWMYLAGAIEVALAIGLIFGIYTTLAAAVDEEQDTIEDVYEPYLLQEGLIQRTPRGRVATPRAFRHLGLEPPPPGGAQAGLF